MNKVVLRRKSSRHRINITGPSRAPKTKLINELEEVLKKEKRAVEWI